MTTVSVLKKMAAAISVACVLFVAPGEAKAVQISVGGQDYDVAAIEGSFNDNAALLTANPWWGNAGIAYFATATINNSLGLPNLWFGDFPASPYFAFDDFGGSSFVDNYFYSPTWAGIPVHAGFDKNESLVYAVATPVASVPEPEEWVGTLAGIGCVVAMRRRKRTLAQNANASSNDRG
jgi:hypothetical protein